MSCNASRPASQRPLVERDSARYRRAREKNSLANDATTRTTHSLFVRNSVV
ncbi:hypothetical protein [Lysobacter gummosus]|uniref:hypothetical protein n=1 Tax=Lysobacter gummosus TaxID=262324 RepID=UPI0036366AE4